MSFGFSLGDFFAVGQLAWSVYKSCKGAGGAFEEISHEVISLHTAIKELEDEIDNADSILNRTGTNKKKELKLLFQNCHGVLQELNKLLIKYKSLGTKSKRTWDRLRWGTENLAEIRERIMIHTSSLNLFLTTLGTSSLGRIEKKLDQLIDDVRAGKREETILTMADTNEDEADTQWNLWKTELIDDGFTKVELESHKHWIKAKLAELIERGGLHEEPPPDNPISSSKINPKNTISKDTDQPEYTQPSTKSPAFQASVEDADDADEERGLAARPKSAKEKYEVPESSQVASPTEKSEDYESEESDNTFLPTDSISNVGKSGLKTKSSQPHIRKKSANFQQLDSENILGQPRGNQQSSSFGPRTSSKNRPSSFPDSDSLLQSERRSQDEKLALESNIRFMNNLSRLPDNDEYSSENDSSSSILAPQRQGEPSHQRSVREPTRYMVTNGQATLQNSDQEADIHNFNEDEYSCRNDKSPGGVQNSANRSPLRNNRHDGSPNSGNSRGPSLAQSPTLQTQRPAPPIFVRQKPSRSKTEYQPNPSRANHFTKSHSRQRSSKSKQEVSSDSEYGSSVHHRSPRVSHSPPIQIPEPNYYIINDDGTYSAMLRSSRSRSDLRDLNDYPRERSESLRARYPSAQPPITHNPPSSERVRASSRNQPDFYSASPDRPEPIILSARPKISREYVSHGPSGYAVPPPGVPYQKISYSKNYPSQRHEQSTAFHFPNSNETQSSRGFSFTSPESIFSEFLNSQTNIGGGNVIEEMSRYSEVQTQDMEKEEQLKPLAVEKPLLLTLEELFHGTNKKMKVSRRSQEGETESLFLEMNIKPGWKAGTRIKFKGVGDFVDDKFQDLHFVVEEKKHPFYTRQVDDLHQEVAITLLESLCGWEDNISTIDGKVINIEKAGPIQPGSKDTYPGLGMPLSKKPGERGCFILTYVVIYPMNLSQ